MGRRNEVQTKQTDRPTGIGNSTTAAVAVAASKRNSRRVQVKIAAATQTAWWSNVACCRPLLPLQRLGGSGGLKIKNQFEKFLLIYNFLSQFHYLLLRQFPQLLFFPIFSRRRFVFCFHALANSYVIFSSLLLFHRHFAQNQLQQLEKYFECGSGSLAATCNKCGKRSQRALTEGEKQYESPGSHRQAAAYGRRVPTAMPRCFKSFHFKWVAPWQCFVWLGGKKVAIYLRFLFKSRKVFAICIEATNLWDSCQQQSRTWRHNSKQSAQRHTHTHIHTNMAKAMAKDNAAHGHRKHGNNNDITLYLGFRQRQRQRQRTKTRKVCRGNFCRNQYFL